MLRLLVLLLCMVTPALAGEAPLPTVIGSGAAIEGDSVSVNGQVVRLWGIDAPEVKQTCFTRTNQVYDCFTPAKNTLAGFIGQRQVTCYIRGQDNHGQKVGTCAVDGLDLAALVIRAGWAFAYTDLATQYMDLEGEAQAKRRGLWAGRAESPWAWRNRQQNAQKP